MLLVCLRLPVGSDPSPPFCQYAPLVVATQTWGLTPAQVAAEYALTLMQIQEALAFYAAHRDEIDAGLAAEEALEASAHGPTAPPS